MKLFETFLKEVDTQLSLPGMEDKPQPKRQVSEDLVTVCGRHNPPHMGHGLTFDKAHKIAGNIGEDQPADQRFYTSRVQQQKKDPLPHGEKKRFAEKIGVDATTISRWRKGAQKPTGKKITAILDYFNLPESTDLSREPLFLTNMPIGEAETKQWLHEKIDDLDGETLMSLLPALIRLLMSK